MTLNLTEETVPEGYERLVFAEDTESGLQAFICVHSTTLGPAAGGCRMWDYATLNEARRDVLRLAQGMTCKNAMADLALGGGKSVIVGNARTDKSPALLRAFGRAVQSLNGSYYTAEDVGISPEDMKIVAEETPYAVGLEGVTMAPVIRRPLPRKGYSNAFRSALRWCLAPVISLGAGCWFKVLATSVCRLPKNCIALGPI